MLEAALHMYGLTGFIDNVIEGSGWNLSCIDLTSEGAEVTSEGWHQQIGYLRKKPTDRKMVLWLWKHGRNDGCFYLLGVRVFIEKKAQLTLLGTEMDFVETKLNSEFIFNNPNIKGMCGCGESFNVWACQPTLNRKDWTLLRALDGGNIWSSRCACISTAVLPADHFIITGVAKTVLMLYFSITDLITASC